MKKRSRKNLNGLLLSLMLCCTLLLPACYEPKEGCLDAQATNFELDADEACPDCCEYPSLQLALRHRIVLFGQEDDRFSTDSVYYDGSGQPFRFKNIRFYLSNVRLVRSDGSVAMVSDTIELNLYDPSGAPRKATVEDNFLLANPLFEQTYTIGAFRESGSSFEKIRFAIGVEGIANEAIPDSLPDDYPLGRIEETLDLHFNQDSGYVFSHIELFRDTTAADTIPVVLRIGTLPYLRTVELSFPSGGFTPTDGFNTLVTLQVNYVERFQSLNIRQDTPAQMIEKIVQNLANSFSVIAIEKK
ncbi:MAG: MbnP family protein [Saprospiraceae bacterium]